MLAISRLNTDSEFMRAPADCKNILPTRAKALKLSPERFRTGSQLSNYQVWLEIILCVQIYPAKSNKSGP